MEKDDKEIKEELRQLRDDLKENKEGKKDKKEPNNQSNNQNNDMLSFFLGIIMLGLGLFLLSKRVILYSAWYTWRIGTFNLSSGLVTVPLIIGIIWQFYNSKSVIPKIIITLGVVFIVATIIMSIKISFMATSMFDYILIIGLAAAGSGLLLKALFKKQN